MRVLITHELYPPDVAGGGERVVQHTAEGLLQRGAHVRVLTTGDPEIGSYNSVATSRMPGSKYRMNLAVRRIAAEAKHADIIQTFTYHACLPSLIAGRLTRKPVVMTCLGLFGESWRQMRGPALGRGWEAWERFMIRQPFDRIFFLSDYSLRAGLQIGARSERCSIAEPGVEHHKFPVTPDKSGVLFVGKLDVRKGIDDVLAVAAALPHVPFTVIGWGPDEARYRAQATANVTFEQLPPPDELWVRFSKASVFFLPSYAETFGMALTQAMAGGCAVVSSIPLPFEGVRVRAGDREAMVRAITRLHSDEHERRAMGARNRNIAAEYTWERFCATLESAYTQIVSERLCPSSSRQ